MDDLPDSVYKKRVDLEELKNYMKEVLEKEYSGTVRIDVLFGGGLMGRGRTEDEDAENRPDISISSMEDPDEAFADFLEEFVDKHDYVKESKFKIPQESSEYNWVLNLRPEEFV